MGRAGSALFAVSMMMCSSSLAPSQEILHLDGYVVTFPSYLNTNHRIASLFGAAEKQFVDITRVRLRPSLSLSETGFLMLEYEIGATYTSAFPASQGQSMSNPRQAMDMSWTIVEGSRWNITHFVDRLYFRQTTSAVDVTIGRQRISWGTGRIWNPTDLFNPLNPATYSKIEKDGVDALLAKFVLGNFSDISLVFNAKEHLKDNNYGLRFRSNVEGFDFSVMGGSFDKRVVVGGDFAGSVFDAGIRGEGISSTSKQDPSSNFVSLIAGIDNQFTEKLYALVEYHFNGRGTDIKWNYNLAALLQGEILNVGRQYATLFASYLVHPLVTLSVSTTRSLTDRSGYLAGTVAYSSSDETSLSLGGQYFYGESYTEYWYYPNSAYLKFDIYF